MDSDFLNYTFSFCEAELFALLTAIDENKWRGKKIALTKDFVLLSVYKP